MNCEILFTIPLNLFCLKYIQKARTVQTRMRKKTPVKFTENNNMKNSL